jgi:glycerol-3-phosphate cytidylyltransferase-like family protein
MSKEMALNQTEWDLHQNPEKFIPLEFTEEIKPDLFGIELSKAQEMTNGLSATLAEREILKNAYIDVIGLEINAESLPIFKELRLKIVKNRTQGIEKWHANNKAFYLAGGRFVDAVKNKEIIVNQEMESKLLEGEKYFENLEKEAKRLLNIERIERIRPYIEHADALDFTEMNEYDFDDFVLGKKTRFENEAKQRKIEAERIEAERIAELKRQKAIEDENKILKAKIEAERLKRIEAEKIEAERIEAERIEAELKAKAPIKEQLNIWVDSFELPYRIVINEQSEEIALKFEDFKKWAKNKINTI